MGRDEEINVQRVTADRDKLIPPYPILPRPWPKPKQYDLDDRGSRNICTRCGGNIHNGSHGRGHCGNASNPRNNR